MGILGNKSVLTVFVCAIILVSIGEVSFAAEKKKPDDIWISDTSHKGSHISKERINELLKRIKSDNPELAKKLEELRKSQSDKFHGEFFKAARKYLLSDQDKERFKASIGEYVEWLKENYPEEDAKLAKIQENSPDIYTRHVMMSKRRYGKIMDTQKKNPALAEIMKEDLHLNRRRYELVGKINKAKGKEAEKLKKELEEVVSARFDLVVRKKQLQYESLEKKIESIKRQIAKQKIAVQKLKDNKIQATKERIEDLLSDKEKVKWDK